MAEAAPICRAAREAFLLKETGSYGKRESSRVDICEQRVPRKTRCKWKCPRGACVWRTGESTRRPPGHTAGCGMDRGASMGAARADDLGPLVRALDLTLSKKASQCLHGRGE